MARAPFAVSLSFLLLVVPAGACGPAARAHPTRPPADAVLAEVGAHYAELGRMADSLTAETGDESDAMSGERLQVAARNLAGRIGEARGGFEAITLSMTSSQLERTRPLWVRLAVTEAALELLYEDATRLASDPAATPDEVYALSAQLSGSLELGRESSRLAARQVQPRPITR
jgi:hypothetical protein